MGIKKLEIRLDSQLVVNQLLGTYHARASKMASYLAHVKTLQFVFEEFNLTHVPRLENSHADDLANLGSSVLATEFQTIPIIYLQWIVV